MSGSSRPPILCLSHLRWDGVYQRPNHLMARAARGGLVVWCDPPTVRAGSAARTQIDEVAPSLVRVVPELPAELAPDSGAPILRTLLRQALHDLGVERPIAWFYTPLALRFAGDLDVSLVVFDSMDDLTAFRHASPLLAPLESALLDRADLVFAGGTSLWRRLAGRHPACHPFPSAVDAGHFRQARLVRSWPHDGSARSPLRLGYAGVIDERLDLDLLREVADRRRDWSIVLAGPVAKIDPATIPVAPNIVPVGPLSYGDLPREMATWDVALMPFAHNDATRSISPTKTLEYLAAGLPIVSTAIADVVEPYGRLGLVRIADDADGWIREIAEASTEPVSDRLAAADAFLATRSWDRTWSEMWSLVEAALPGRRAVAPAPEASAMRLQPGAPTAPVSFPGNAP